MKRLLTIFTLLILMVSCTKEVDFSQIDNSGDALSFTASVMDMTETKATLRTSWIGGEEIALFVDGVDDVYRFTISANGTMTLHEDCDDIVVDRESSNSYTAFYPYDSTLRTIDDYNSACKSGEVDYMKADTTASGKAIELKFTHQLAVLSFNVMIGESVSNPAITLYLDGDINNPIELILEQSVTEEVTKLSANYFVEDGTDVSSAFIEVEQNSLTSFHLIEREQANTLSAGGQYFFNYYIGYVPPGSGTENDPYIIYLAEDLRKVGTGTDGWDMNSSYKLANDINLESVEFTPIGSSSSSFKGTFDGAGFEIKGLSVYNPTSNYQGLFGHTTSAKICNLSVSGSVTGYESVGGIVGYASSTTVENCCSAVTVVGEDYWVGGIAGDANYSTVINCYNTGSVTGKTSVGGIIGYSTGSNEVVNCYNRGALSSNDSFAIIGGIIGTATYDSSSKITNCYNAGSISISNYDTVGGIVGYSGSSNQVSSCYYNVQVFTGNALGSDSQIETDCLALSTSVMQMEYFLNLLNNGAYAYNSTSPNVEACSWSAVADDYPVLNFEGTPTYTEIKEEDIPSLEFVYEGSGTESDPYLIDSEETLRYFALSVSSGRSTYLDVYFKMTTDIDLVGSDGDNEFTAIGTRDSPFEGSFDGDGHEITSLNINETGIYQGLFGYINGATIKNLGVSGSVKGKYNVGGIAGCAINSTIEQCFSSVNLDSEDTVGGIVGVITGSTVKNCYNRATFSADCLVGGIVGGAEGESSIENCYNTGSVTGYSTGLSGGVTGASSSANPLVEYCYYDLEVVTGVTGAVKGANSDIIYCGLSTEDMKGAASTEGTMLYYFTNSSYGNSSSWMTDDTGINDGYPILTWQVTEDE